MRPWPSRPLTRRPTSPDDSIDYPAAPWHMVGPAVAVDLPARRRRRRAPPAGHVRRRVRLLRAGQPADLLRAPGRPAGADREARPVRVDHRHLGRLPRLGRRRPRAVGDPEGPVRLRPRDQPPRPALAHRLVGHVRRASRSRARPSPTSPRHVRVPFKGTTWQPGIEDTDGEERTAVLQGSAKVLPCRGRWDFAADGPLGWMRGARQLASFRQADFRMSFG